MLVNTIQTLAFLFSFQFVLSCSNPPNKTITMTPLQLAYSEQEGVLNAFLLSENIKSESLEVYLRTFKEEQIIEIFGRNKGDKNFSKLKEYSFCKSSGRLGPKRKEGDLQIPEGCYHINRFNPKSKFHLSLGINYPNKSDVILGDKEKPGSDIFIHGGCQTVGCIPITDTKMRELYVLVEFAKKSGQRLIPVDFFPYQMSAEKWNKYSIKYPEFIPFWKTLKPFYDFFEEKKDLLKVGISDKGEYEILK